MVWRLCQIPNWLSMWSKEAFWPEHESTRLCLSHQKASLHGLALIGCIHPSCPSLMLDQMHSLEKRAALLSLSLSPLVVLCFFFSFPDYLTFWTHQILLLFWFSVSSNPLLLMIQQSANTLFSWALKHLCGLFFTLLHSHMTEGSHLSLCWRSNHQTAHPGTRHTLLLHSVVQPRQRRHSLHLNREWGQMIQYLYESACLHARAASIIILRITHTNGGMCQVCCCCHRRNGGWEKD